MRALVVLVVWAPAAYAFCPSYTATSSSNTGDCGVEAVAGINPSLEAWQSIFDEVAHGQWGSNGPAIGTIGRGCGKPMPQTSVNARFPCEILRSIAYQESGWKQFCEPDRPADQVGRASQTIISFDCGYGVGQVTSGMHVGESPAFDRSRVAGDARYNLATGASILANKWSNTSCVGDNQPDLIEDWYLAVWAYNGLSSKNNPNNPNYSTTRGVWNPQVGGSAPYQEKVFGWAEYPPTGAHWVSVRVAYPDATEIGADNNPPSLSEPACASPTSCATNRGVHRSACAPLSTGGGSATGGGSNAGGGGAAAGGGNGHLGGGAASMGGSSGATGGGVPPVSHDGGVRLPDGGWSEYGVVAQGGCGCQGGDALAEWWCLLLLGGLARRWRFR